MGKLRGARNLNPRESAMPRWILFALLLATSGGCSNYDLTVNEKVVYTPRPLFSDFTVTDDGLRTCIEQAIIDQQVTRPNELLVLNCSAAEIGSLDGLGLFTGLRQLSLASNQIEHLHPLAALSSLESLDLTNNRIVDPVALYELLSLRVLDLSGNPQLQCPGHNALFQLDQLILPAHCTRP